MNTIDIATTQAIQRGWMYTQRGPGWSVLTRHRKAGIGAPFHIVMVILTVATGLLWLPIYGLVWGIAFAVSPRGRETLTLRTQPDGSVAYEWWQAKAPVRRQHRLVQGVALPAGHAVGIATE